MCTLSGKEVGPVDFSNYLRFHNRKLFKAAYAPRPFCYAIRRPDHYPEGTLSIGMKTFDKINLKGVRE